MAKSIWKSHRDALAARLRDAVAVVFAAPEQIRNNDVHHDYRPDSDFFYLTGREDPQCVLCIPPHRAGGDQTPLFFPPKNPARQGGGCRGAASGPTPPR